MIEKILKDTNVNPKVELTQKEYNDLVALARRPLEARGLCSRKPVAVDK